MTTDLSMYVGLWVALTESDEVASTGTTLEDTQYAARISHPKEYLRWVWVSPHPPHIAIPDWPLSYLKYILPSHGLWLAGGPVRDLLLGRRLHDWDFAVTHHAMQLARKVADALNAAYYPLDKSRDTGRVVAKAPNSQLITLDFAALRGNTLEQDLHLRDFTINAIAMQLDGELIDPTGGLHDLKNKVIRATSKHTFQNDPARLLRAIRQSSELDFQLEPKTRALLRAQASLIRNIAPERIQSELFNILSLRPTAQSLQKLKDLNLLAKILPEVQKLEVITQTSPHCYPDAWAHTLATITSIEMILAQLEGQNYPQDGSSWKPPAPQWAWDMLKNMLVPLQPKLLAYLAETPNVDMSKAKLLKWGALFHDVGKVSTRSVDEQGLAHFYGHAKIGAELTQSRLEALHFPKKANLYISMLVKAHMRLISMSKNTPTRRAIYRFYRATEEAGVGIILLALADALAVWGAQLSPHYWQRLLKSAAILLRAYFERQEIIHPIPLLDGHDLITIGVPKGPKIGHILEALSEAQAAGDISTREAAEAFVHEQQKA